MPENPPEARWRAGEFEGPMQQIADPLPRSEFWMKIAGACFALWALMIPIGIAMVRSTFSDVAQANMTLASTLTEYKLLTERRITLLEERQSAVIAHNAGQDQRLGQLERSLYFQMPGEKPPR
jgi:hypothetical protein